MTEAPKYFAKHYYGSATEIAYKRKYSFSNRWRYYYATPEVELTRAAICAKVELLSIQLHAGTWVNSFLYSNRFGGLCKVQGGDLLMTDDEKKILTAEFCNLSPQAQEIMKKFFTELATLKNALMECNSDLPHEIWRDVYGYEGLYQVSNFGRVKSFHFGNQKFLKLLRDIKGYIYVVLHKNGKLKARKVHRLVAVAFVTNPDGKPQVNHIDGNKSNNRVENLEWVSNSENKKHSYQIGICKPKIGTKNGRARLTAEDVRYIRKNYKPHDKKLGQFALARKFNVSSSLIGRVLRCETYRNVL